MIRKIVEEIKQKEIKNLYEYIDLKEIRKSVANFNSESLSSEIYACLATYF